MRLITTTSGRTAAAGAVLATGLLAVAGTSAVAAPAAPTVESSGAGGAGYYDPEPYLHPYFSGRAAGLSVVRVYGNSSCTGAVLAEDQADSNGGWYATATVTTGSTTTGFATATDGTGTSPCSTTSSTFTVPPRPDTKITKKPPKVVKWNAERQSNGVRVKLKFKSTTGGKKFFCTVNGDRVFCENGLVLRGGKYKIEVAAIDDTYPLLLDQTPAKYTFKVKAI